METWRSAMEEDNDLNSAGSRWTPPKSHKFPLPWLSKERLGQSQWFSIKHEPAPNASSTRVRNRGLSRSEDLLLWLCNPQVPPQETTFLVFPKWTKLFFHCLKSAKNRTKQKTHRWSPQPEIRECLSGLFWCRGKSEELGPSSEFMTCMTLGKWHDVPEPCFPYLENGDSCTCLHYLIVVGRG